MKKAVLQRCEVFSCPSGFWLYKFRASKLSELLLLYSQHRRDSPTTTNHQEEKSIFVHRNLPLCPSEVTWGIWFDGRRAEAVERCKGKCARKLKKMEFISPCRVFTERERERGGLWVRTAHGVVGTRHGLPVPTRYRVPMSENITAKNSAPWPILVIGPVGHLTVWYTLLNLTI